MKNKISNGFTLFELLIVMAILGILSTVLVVVINPGRQLAKARDTQRETDMIAILGAVYMYTSEHSGGLPDTDGNPATNNFPTSLTCIGSSVGCFDLANAGDTGETIVPEYMAEIPTDPRTNSSEDYLIMVDANGRLIASASGETRIVTFTK